MKMYASLFKCIQLWMLLSLATPLFSQQVIIADSENYQAKSKNALLEIYGQSGNKGILIPRLSSSQREEIDTHPFDDEGLMVYDLQTKSFWFWNGSSWEEIGQRNDQALSLIADADGDTEIHVEKNTDEDKIRMQVDSTELVVLDTNGMYLHGELTLQHGLGVNSISKEISLSKADSVLSTSGAVRGFVSQRSYSSVMEYGATGDGVTDDSEALTKAIMANPHGTLFVPDGVYVANIRVDTPVTLISHSGNVVFKSNQMGKAVLAVHAPVNLHKLRFEHSDSTTNGSDGLWNYGHDINAYDCTFIGHEINATGDASYSRFSNCTFTTRDAGMTTPPSFGTIAWSANSRFDNCLFDGTYGADVQDSDFYHCTFDARWGIHMPDGKISNNGSASGFEGDGEFHHCTIIGREFYAIGIGNDAHPKLYNCTVVGHASAAYARTQSTYEAYNCFFKATKLFGGSSVLVMSKWPTATHSNIGLVGSGDSYFSNCTFSGGQFHLNIPDREDAGKLYFTNCTYDANRIYVDQQTSGNGDKDKYLVDASATQLADMGIAMEEQLNVSGNGPLNFHLPKGYKISSIILQEANDAYAGTVQLGNSSGGSQISLPIAVSAGGLMEAPVKKGFFSLDDDTNIYISSDNWGSAAINVYIKMEKVR